MSAAAMLAITAAAGASSNTAREAHNNNCLVMQDGNKYCKEEPMTNKGVGAVLIVVFLLAMYLCFVFWLADVFWHHMGKILFLGLASPFLIFGLVLYFS